MRFLNAQISNYKSVVESVEFSLTDGFNVIVGKNNSGKSALTDALSLRFGEYPHKSKATLPDRRTPVKSNSSVIATFQVSISDVKSIIKNSKPHFLLVKNPDIAQSTQIARLKKVFDNEFLSIKFRYASNTLQYAHLLPYWQLRSGEALEYRLGSTNEELEGGDRNRTWNENDDLPVRLVREFINRVYTFRAERFHVGQSSISDETALNSDAGNLPSVLLNLKSRNYFLFSKLLQYVKAIFPEIKDINLITYDSARSVKIYMSHVDPADDRPDLDIALQDSGTGIGQVLAMLYVVVNAKDPQVIVIDEPQSFLHPDAVRKLFSILNKDFGQHQYIITTHSPTAIFSANPKNIIHVRKENHVSDVNNVALVDKDKLTGLLLDVGARLSDVFGADGIIWVEGKTEEVCFPEIAQKMGRNPLLGNVILGVINKGDLEQRKRRSLDLVLDIYSRVSSSTALLPQAVGFIFDKEKLSAEEIADAEKRTQGKVSFLSRRMFENYLIHPKAIFHLISGINNFSDQEITEDTIALWLQENKWRREFFDSPVGETDKTEDYYWTNVSGADVLEALFIELSNKTHSYIQNKVTYGKQLTSWILENDSSCFEEISSLIDKHVIAPN